RLAVHPDLALVGLGQPVQDVHQGRLAGPVLAQQGADLAGLDRQVNVIVGHQAAETLGDAGQLKLHGSSSFADAVGSPARARAGPGPGHLRPRAPEAPGAAVWLQRLRRALRSRLNLATDDVGLDLVQLALDRSRDLAFEVVERRQADPVVRQRADVVAALEVALLGGLDGPLHRDRDALVDAGDEVLAVLGNADAAVGVHPHHVDLLAAR